MRMFESTDTRRWFALVTYNGDDITHPIPLNYVEIEDPPEPPWFAGQGMDMGQFVGRLRFGFYQVSVSESEIDQCLHTPVTEVFIYPDWPSDSFVKFSSARHYSYIISPDVDFVGATEVELGWTFMGTSVEGLDCDQFRDQPMSLEPIRWQESGF